jgi:hypothetical protein
MAKFPFFYMLNEDLVPDVVRSYKLNTAVYMVRIMRCSKELDI